MPDCSGTSEMHLKVYPCYSMCQIFLPFKAKYYSIVCIHNIFLSYLSVNGDLICVHILAVVKKVAMNMGVEKPLQVIDFNYFGYIPRNEISRSYDNSIFNFLERC